MSSSWARVWLSSKSYPIEPDEKLGYSSMDPIVCGGRTGDICRWFCERWLSYIFSECE
jgi:hypothetical protein